MQYFVVLTVQFQRHSGVLSMCTISRIVTVEPASTRGEIYAWALRELPERAWGGNPVFFSAEPNRIGG